MLAKGIDMEHRAKTPAAPKDQRGIALLEGLIAILIFSMGILAVMGLQAVSIKNSASAKYRTDASFLANQIIGQMWMDHQNLASYGGTYAAKTSWLTQVGNTLPGGTGTIAVAGDKVTVTVKWQAAGEGGHQYVAVAQIGT